MLAFHFGPDDRIEVDECDGRTIEFGELSGTPLPSELQKSLAVPEGLHPVRHTRVAVGDDNADFVVRVRLGLRSVQRGLVVDVVQRDVPETPQLEA